MRTPEEEYLHEHLRVHELPLTKAEEVVDEELAQQLRKTRERVPAPEPVQALGSRSAASDSYSRSELETDQTRLADLKKRQRDEKTDRSVLFERFLKTDGAVFGWLGEPDKVHLVETTEFDDRFHHVDCVLVVTRPDREPLYLAIDATVSHPSSGSPRLKRQRLEKDVISGSLTKIKYFIDHRQGDQNGPLIRRLTQVPRVVIGLNSDTITEISKPLAAHYRPRETYQAYLQSHKLSEIARAGKGTREGFASATRRELIEHPLALDLPAEICAQVESQALLACAVYLDRATRLLERQSKLRSEYLPSLNRLDEALKEFRAAVLAGPANIKTDDLNKLLERVVEEVKGLEPIQSDIRYPFIPIIKKYQELIEVFRPLVEERQKSAREPIKKDPTIRFFTEPWETDADERRELERQLAAAA